MILADHPVPWILSGYLDVLKLLYFLIFTMTFFCYNLYHLIWMILELFGLHPWNLKGYKYSLIKFVSPNYIAINGLMGLSFF